MSPVLAAANIAADPGFRVLTVLYIEDDPATADIFETVLLQGTNRDVRIVTVPDVASALAAVANQGIYAGLLPPDLIVLDLNLPNVRGFALLESLQANPGLARIPVVVFSASVSFSDRRRAEALGVKEFIPKPVDLDGFAAAVSHIYKMLLQSSQPGQCTAGANTQ